MSEKHKATHQNITIDVVGRLALFTDPLSRLGGFKQSYSVPTYSALVGLLNRMYSRPSIYWVVDECRVINRINYEPISRVDPFKNGVGERYIYQYLYDCEYVIKAHYLQNKRFPEINRMFSFSYYSNEIAHQIKCGGERDLYFGCRECQALIRKKDVSEIKGYYDGSGTIDLGEMFHSIVYPANDDKYIYAKHWHATMQDGVIRFPKPNECPTERAIFKREYSDDPIDFSLYLGGYSEPKPKFIRNRKASKGK